MNSVFLLNSGQKIPLIGFGTFQIRSKELIFEVLDYAFASGYRHIDSAVVYKNEHFIGEALKSLLPKYNLQRNDVFLTTKLIPSVNQSEEDVISTVKQSLAFLQTDYVDLYLIHWPGVSGLPSGHVDNRKQRHLTWRALEKCRESGLINSIGVSNFLVRHLEDLNSSGVVPAVNQVEWHPHHHDNELLNYCRKNGIFLQAYSSLGSSNDSSLRQDPKVIEISKKRNCTPVQVLLRWAFQNNIGILPKASSREHIEENIDLNFVLSEEDVKELSNLKVNEKYAWDPQVVA